MHWQSLGKDQPALTVLSSSRAVPAAEADGCGEEGRHRRLKGGMAEPEPEDWGSDAAPTEGSAQDTSTTRQHSGLASIISELKDAPAATPDDDDEGEYDPSMAVQDTEIRVPLGSDEEKKLVAQMRVHLADTGLEDSKTQDEFWLLASLRARKFDPQSAATRFQKYIQWRTEYRIDELGQPSNERMQAWLRLQVARWNGGKDRVGRYLVQMTMRNTRPDLFSAEDTMRGIHLVLETLLRAYPDAQARGVALVADLRDVAFKNLDPRVPKLLGPAMSSVLPVRLGRFHMCCPPWFFKLVFPLMMRFQSPKMKSRTAIRSDYTELCDEIEVDQLLPETGGLVEFDHGEWLTTLIHGEAVDAVTVSERDGQLTVLELAALIVRGDITGEAELATNGMSATPLEDLVDMEMVEECDEDDTEELAASLAESMRGAGARLPAF